MSVIVIRHGLSEANNRNNFGNLAFAAEQAPLMYLGRKQAREVGQLLLAQYDINPAASHAATSKLLRTQQTAHEAGFINTTAYPQLNEVNHGVDLIELRAMLDNGKLPSTAIAAAELTLENPPEETIWFTHGLQIAGLCAVLGVHQDLRLVPRFCEIRELPI